MKNFLKKISIVSCLAMIMVLALSVSVVTAEYGDSSAKFNLEFHEESFLRMGLSVDLGSPIPNSLQFGYSESSLSIPIGDGMYTRPNDSVIEANIEPISSIYVGNGMYAASNESVIEVYMPSIRRHSEDVEISITREDMELLLDFAYSMFDDKRPIGFDTCFIEALQEAGLYDDFFSRVNEWMPRLNDTELARALEARERQIQLLELNLSEYESDYQDIDAGVEHFSQRIPINNLSIPGNHFLYDRNFSLMLGDIVTYNISYTGSGGVTIAYLQQSPFVPRNMWIWGHYNRSPVIRNNPGRIVTMPGWHDFTIRNNSSSRITVNGSYTVAW